MSELKDQLVDKAAIAISLARYGGIFDLSRGQVDELEYEAKTALKAAFQFLVDSNDPWLVGTQWEEKIAGDVLDALKELNND